MTITVNNKVIGKVMTNRTLTVDEALYALGYDLNDEADLEKGYNEGIEGFYLGCFGDGDYRFDYDAVEFCV